MIEWIRFLEIMFALIFGNIIGYIYGWRRGIKNKPINPLLEEGIA